MFRKGIAYSMHLMNRRNNFLKFERVFLQGNLFDIKIISTFCILTMSSILK